MNQIVSFMLGMIPLVMNGKKYMTTRLETDFRLKLNIGDKMYIYSGIRTKDAVKHGEAIVIDRWRWNQSIFTERKIFITENDFSPTFLKWSEFTKVEGFNNLNELIEFFNQKRYRDKNLITYQFEVIE